MARVSTDDAARRQKFIWLGTPDFPWPFEASGQAWLIGMVLCPTLTVVAFLVSPRFLFGWLFPGPVGFLAAAATSVVVGVAAGVLITRRIGRAVSPTRPLRHHIATLIGEISSPREQRPTMHVLHPGRGIFLEDEATSHQIGFPHFID